MKIEFSEIIAHIEKAKINSFVSDALSYNENLFKEIRKKLPPKLKIPGFSSVYNVTYSGRQKLVPEIKKFKIYDIPAVGKLILKGWYLKNTKTVEIVKTQLLDCGYDVCDPDFNSDFREIKSLHEVDLFIDKAKCRFFRPGGNQIEGLSDSDATIGSAILGWFVFTKEEMVKMMDIEGGDQIQKEELGVIEIVNFENLADADPEGTCEQGDSEINQEEETASFTTEDKINRLEQLFKEESKYFTEISQSLFKGILPESDLITHRIESLAESLKNIADSFVKNEKTEIKSLIELKELYKTALAQDSKIEKESVLQIINKIRAISHKKGQTPKCIGKLKNIAKDYISGLGNDDCKSAEWYSQIITGEHYFNLLITIIETRNLDDYDEISLDNLLTDLKADLIKHEWDFYEELATQINRGNIFISHAPLPDLPTTNSNEEKLRVQNTSFSNEENKLPIKDIPELITEALLEETVAPEIEAVNITGLESDEVVAPKELPPALNESAIEKTNEDFIEPFSENGTINLQANYISLEDAKILELLKIDEPELAFHLSKCYEADQKELLLPSYLLQNLFLSQYIRTSAGPIAQRVEPNIVKCDLLVKKTKGNTLVNQMVFASVLRLCFFAYDSTGAGQLLHVIYTGVKDEFYDLKKYVVEFMDQNSSIFSFDRISRICGYTKLEEIKKVYLNRIGDWLEKAQTLRFQKNASNYHSQVFYNWVKNEGWINSIITKFLKEKNGNVLRMLLEEELQDSTWGKKYQKELKALAGNQKDVLDNSNAFRWISQNIDGLKNILEEGRICFEYELEEFSQQDDNKIINFINKIINEVARVKKSFDNSREENLFEQISKKYLLKALGNLENVLNGTVDDLEQSSVHKIENRSLLKLPYYESDINWQPIAHNNHLSELILRYLDNPTTDWNEIAITHIQSGNVEAFNRLVSLNIVEESKLTNAEALEDFPDWLKTEIRQAKIEIERGCAFGYILNGHREDMLSLLNSIEQENKLAADGINFPLRKTQIKNILDEISSEKKELIEKGKSLITSDIKLEHRDYLNDLLNRGNLLVFNDTLERVKTGQFIFEEHKNGLFKDFYMNFLPKETGREVTQISKAIRHRTIFKSFNFSKITEFQAKEAEAIINEWHILKRVDLKKDLDSFLRVNTFLEILGFVSSEYETGDTYGKVLYFDFSCIPIEGRTRTALPKFGSVAKGKYRLILYRDRMTEEDQFETLRDLIPTTSRAVIVFNFFWMTKVSRLELAKLSKKNRATFLLLDEAMLLYLLGQKESKFPAFIKLAAPFTFAEPYQTASSNLPVEMFYGRNPQIEKLKNIIGDFSCLIYGGRQLGKTVLQHEVVRIFNQPEKKSHAIYVDLRDCGIGLWKPVEETVGVLIENLSAIPDLIPEKVAESAGIVYLTGKIKEWIDKNKDARIILFLDESDKFLEQEVLKGWPNVLPLKGLMEKTEKRFKVVFAGLHNVRRTMKIPNNPLAHFGSPICVGPMLEKEEALEAQMLITLPIETLGAEFESEDLIFMILSHCNWYPSLIQIFCSKLLNVMYEKRNIKELPIVITSTDVTDAYKNSRNHIKEKFNLTLSLDERYDLLANIIAYKTIVNPSVHIQSFSAENITDDAMFYWPAGFDNANPKVEVKFLLDEMVDLGILRMEQSGNVALRTPNLLGLIGDEKQINDNLFLKDRKLPTEFNREISRIMYLSGSKKLMSPFPAFYYDKLINPEIRVVLFRGSLMGGIEHITDFLKNHKKEINLITPDFANLNSDYLDDLDKIIVKNRSSSKHNVLLFGDQRKFTFEEIEAVRKRIEPRSKLTAVFLIGSESLWTMLSESDKLFERLENQKIELFNIPQWRPDVAMEWFKETGCITANIPKIFDSLSNWHKLIVEYYESIVDEPESWKEKLVTFEEKLKAEAKNSYANFGLLNPPHIAMISELIEWDGSITRDEFINQDPNVKSPKELENMIDYFLFLNLIDNSLKVNPLVKKILSYE